MADNDFALGSALVIPPDLIGNLEKADKHIESIQQNADKAAKSVKSLSDAFKELNTSLTPAATNLESIASSLAKIDAKGVVDVFGKTAEKSEAMNGAVTKTAESIDKMNQSVNKDYDAWMALGDKIQSATERQQVLLKETKAYEETINRINSGKGGVVGKDDSKDYENNKKELETLSAKIEKYREEQQQIVANNQAYQKRKQLLEDLKAYNNDSKSLETMRKDEELQRMNAYYRELEKSSAKAAKAAEKDFESAEKAAAKYDDKVRKATASTEAYGRSFHNQQQAMYNSLFGKGSGNADLAISDANFATSINERKEAIKQLTAARDALSTSDKNYKQTLDSLNTKIKELNQANKEAIAGSKALGEQYNSLGAMAERMGKRLMLYFSFDLMKDFVNQIVAVRGNFELQQRSLEAILQNKNQADEIFNKTVQLAVKSPFKIQELVTYTKQLAAYRIENDKLYDTTKRLADVSAGLGVEMQRLILAYGQVKAAAFLRGTEVRQFTEAGVNMYGELQKYFLEVKGEAYTTAQIVDMISKRMVTFEDVEAIFERLTDKGGTFYNMQEIQAETLRGKISNLADSFAVMYNEIGKGAEGYLKSGIDATRMLIDNWRTLANIGKLLAEAMLLMYLYAKANGKSLKTLFSEVVVGANKSIISINSLKTALMTVSKTVGTVMINLQKAFMANLPLVAFMAAIEVATTLYSKFQDVSKATNEANSKYAASKVAIDNLTESYNRLSLATSKAKNEEDKLSNTNSKRAELQKLLDLMSKEGLVLNIEVADIEESKLDEEFSKAKDKYETFLLELAIMRKRVADNHAKYDWWFISDDATQDSKDYSDAVAEALSHSGELADVVNQLAVNYKALSIEARGYIDSVKDGKKEGETEIEYYNRVVEALVKIMNTSQGDVFNKTSNALLGLGSSFTNVTDNAKEFEKELDRIFVNGKENAKKNPLMFRAIFNTWAAENEIDDFSRKLAEKHFGIILDVDKSHTEEQLASLSDQIQNFFKGKTYKLNIDTGDLDVSDAAGTYEKEMRNYLNRLKALIEWRKRADSVYSKGGTINGYDATKVENEINDLINKLRAAGYDKEVNDILGLTKKAKEANRQLKDIIQERISVLTNMQSAFEKLSKQKGYKDAVDTVLKSYASSIKESSMPAKVMEGFVPTKQGVMEALQRLLPYIKEQAKRASVKLQIDKLKVEIDEENLKKQLENTKNEIESMFNGLDLHTKLTQLGLGEGEIQRMFGPLNTNLADVKTKITELFKGKYGRDEKEWGTDITKAYTEAIQKATKKQEEYELKTFQDLTKAYKKQMDGQLAIDKWYAEERTKILNSEPLSKNLGERKAYLLALDKEYASRSDSNTWKEFQNSSMYTLLFENIEAQSTRMLNAVRDKMISLRENLNNLKPDELKALNDQIDKVTDQTAKRNPLKNLTKGLKEYMQFLRQRKSLETKFINSNKTIDDLQAQKVTQAESLKIAEEHYDAVVAVYGVNSKTAKEAQEIVDIKRETLNFTLSQLQAEGKISKELATQIANGTALGASLKSSLTEVIDIVNASVSAISNVYSAFGGDNTDVKHMLDVAEATGSLVSSIANGNVVGIIGGAAGLLSSIGSWFSDDSDIDQAIQRMEAEVSALSYAYGKLKQAMDDAFDTSKLLEYRDESIKTLKAQIATYNQMIASESDKKDADSAKIAEWRRQIQELNDTIDELTESMIEALGGFGSAANYKSAAQDFADAWVDAFNQGEDALDALNTSFDKYFNNLIKKQVMMRASSKYIQPILDAIDRSVSEGSAGNNNGADVTAAELAEITKLKNENLAAYNQYLQNFMKVLGVDGSSSSSLSALQQGIQSITETTASALESLLNSMRFMVSQQATDITDIKNYLRLTLGTPEGENTILKELRSQTTYLQKLHSIFDGITTSVSGRGKCLKVSN